jgi:hypothetical protein
MTPRERVLTTKKRMGIVIPNCAMFCSEIVSQSHPIWVTSGSYYFANAILCHCSALRLANDVLAGCTSQHKLTMG